MNALPKGITGFDHAGAVLPWSDIRKPIAAAIWSTGARVEREFSCDAMPTVNYHFVVTTGPSVLVHSLFRLIACADAKEPPYLKVPFVDWPELEAELATVSEWEYLSAEFLNQRVSAEITARLGKGELDQIEYWDPEKIGDVVFNNWD